MRKIWKNGEFLDETEAVFSVYDSAAMYGDAVFEMCRSFNKQLFKLDQHLERLFDSIKFTEMPCNYTHQELKIAHNDLINRNRFEFADDDEYRTFINVSRGPLPIYKDILEVKPWVMITVYPLRWPLRGFSRWYAQGVHAIVPSQRALSSQFLENKVKNHCRLSSRLAEIEVKRQDEHAWPLLVDDNGFITEFTGANFFIVKRDRVITPEPRNCLRGISRNYVLGLCRASGIPYRERNIELYDVITADEAFATATPFCMVPVTKINFKPIGKGRPGKMTLKLMEAWKEAVNCDFVEQAEKWDSQG